MGSARFAHLNGCSLT